MSAPHIYGTVVDALELSEGLSFLNIGAGTGFLSTVVAYITGPAGLNHGIEIHADVVAHARERCGPPPCQTTPLDEFTARAAPRAAPRARLTTCRRRPRQWTGGGPSF